MSSELVPVEPSHDALVSFAEIGIGLQTAQRMALQLNDLVKQQKLSVRIGPKDHLLVEAWCACAALCGMTPRTVWSKRIDGENGVVVGYEARVEVIRLNGGDVVGAAEAECWMDEKLKGYPRWKEKHAAKSMAQTRATSKAIAQILRWIPVLAGYDGTPYEEMGENGQPPLHENPTPKADAPKAQPRSERVTKDEVIALNADWQHARMERELDTDGGKFKAWVGRITGRDFSPGSVASWTRADLDRCVNAVTDGTVSDL